VLACPSRKFRRPPRFRCRRPYNRRAPNSGSEIVRTLVAQRRTFALSCDFSALPLPRRVAPCRAYFAKLLMCRCGIASNRRGRRSIGTACRGVIGVSRPRAIMRSAALAIKSYRSSRIHEVSRNDGSARRRDFGLNHSSLPPPLSRDPSNRQFRAREADS